MIVRTAQSLRTARAFQRAVRRYGSQSTTSTTADSAKIASGSPSVAKVWVALAIGAAGMYGWSNLDKQLTADGEAHPISRFIYDKRSDTDQWMERNAQHIQKTNVATEDQLAFAQGKRHRMVRICDTFAFERGSPYGISVGERVDMSDLKIRHDLTV